MRPSPATTLQLYRLLHSTNKIFQIQSSNSNNSKCDYQTDDGMLGEETSSTVHLTQFTTKSLEIKNFAYLSQLISAIAEFRF
jgi:hypothetical protein